MTYLLETERLKLRKLTMADEPNMAEIICDDETMWAFGGGWSAEANHAGLEKQLKHYATYGFGRWAVELKDTGEFIGICGPQWWSDNNGRILELGLFFKKQHWHKGYATEAARACIRYCFEHLAFSELSSIINAKNLDSMNVAIRCGMLARERYDQGNGTWQYRFSIKKT